MSDTELLFRKGVFIAVRHDTGWWLAQLYTHVYEDSTKARIRWFDQVKDVEQQDTKVFITDECNDIPPQSIICTVKTVRLSQRPVKVAVDSEQCAFIEKVLYDSKQPVSSSSEGELTVVTSNGTSGRPHRKHRNVRKRLLNKAITQRHHKNQKTNRLQKAGKRKASSSPQKTSPSKKLKISPYAGVTVYQNNPINDMETTLPLVAPSVNSLLFNRAVLNKDYAEVEKLHKDRNTFSSTCYYYLDDRTSNENVTKSPWHHAVDNRDKKMIKLLFDLDKVYKSENIGALNTNKKRRVYDTHDSLTTVATGVYNPISLGVDHIRQLTMARGSREGSNAFTPLTSYTEQSVDSTDQIISYAIKSGCDYQFVLYLEKLLDGRNNTFHGEYFQPAVRAGNRAVAAKIAQECVDSGDLSNFNKLHYEILSFDKKEVLSAFKSVSCHKKTGVDCSSGRITPLHSVCLNPNVTYLKLMLSQDPQIDLLDNDRNSLLHYAALSKSDAATKFLLQSNVDPLVTNTTGETPLMWAARTNAIINIKALLGHAYDNYYDSDHQAPLDPKKIVDFNLIKDIAKSAKAVRTNPVKNKTKIADFQFEGGKDKENIDDNIAAMKLKKQGIGGMEMSIVKGSLQSYTALLLAAEHGHLEAVKILLALGADPNKPLGCGPGKRRMTATMVAAKYGYLDILKVLILHGANSKVRDRHGLTAFHYAARYNNLHCLSWLAANCVADVDVADHSGNTALQYACAEGFILVVQYLVDELKVDIGAVNSWGMSALEVAVLRHQKGVIEFLLEQRGVDVNFKDAKGVTMLMKLCAAELSDTASLPLIEYLVKKGADIAAVDNNGCNALHYIVAQKRDAEDVDDIEKCLNFLKDHIDIDAKTINGKTPLVVACDSDNVTVMTMLIKNGADLREVKLGKNRNILQHFAEKAHQDISLDMINSIASSSTKESLMELVSHMDDEGFNALLLAAKAFQEKSNELKTSSSWKKESYQKARDNCLKLIKKFLAAPFKFDINIGVEERKVADDATCQCKQVPHKTSCPKYPYTSYGKYRFLDFMMEENMAHIKMVLHHNPNMNYLGTDGMYPLHRAIIKQNTDLVTLLVRQGAILDLLPEPGYSRTNPHDSCPTLILAVKYNMDVVPMLVDAGACISVTDKEGMTLFHHIVGDYDNLPKRIEIAEKLFPLIENIDEVDNEGNSYLHHAVKGVEHGSNVSIEMISLLLLKGANPNLINRKGQTPLHFAFLSGNPQSFSDPIEVVSILTHVMTTQMVTAADFYHGFTALHLCAMRGGSVTAIHLLSHACDIEKLDNQGNTPLTLAVAGKHQSCVLMLLQRGASIDRCVRYPLFRREPIVHEDKEKQKVVEYYEWLPLKEKPLSCPPVVSHSNLILYKVISYEWQGVLFTLVDMMKESFVPLEAAIRLCKFNLAITLMLKFNKTLNPADANKEGQTLLHCLCFSTATNLELQQRLLNLLLKLDFSVTGKDTEYKCTPLHYSCLHQKFQMSKPLIKANTINYKDKFGRTPICTLFWNSSSPDPEFVKCLVKEGANLESTCDFNIHESDYPLFDYQIKTGKSDYFTSYNTRYTLLGKAVIEDNPTVIKLLLELGANVNTADSRGFNAVMYAVKLNRVKVFNMLTSAQSKYPCRLVAQTNEGQTALHLAVLSHPQAQLAKPVVLNELISLLKDTGDIERVVGIRDNKSKTVFDYCVDNGYERYINILNKAQHLNITVSKNSDMSEINGVPSEVLDYEVDAKTFFDTYTLDIVKEGTNRASPDSHISLKSDECEVSLDDETGQHFDILMTKIDIKQRKFGIYNFYKMQIVKNIGKNIYILVTRWGRIGESGQHQETPFPTLAECKAEFCKVFKSKTKNEWNNIAYFINQPGKYRLVSRERRYKNMYNSINYNFKVNEIPGDIVDIFGALIEACDVKQMKKMLKDDYKLNVANLPFGFITKDNLYKAERILTKIAALNLELSSLKDDITKSENQARFNEKTQEVYDLSNQLYYLVPQTGAVVTKIMPVREQEISNWKNKLQNLKDLEMVNQIMAASQLDIDNKHPIQYVYECLGCTVEKLPKEDIITQYLLRNIHCAKTSVCIKGVYKLNQGARSSVSSKVSGEKQLFYHGTSAGMLLSILKRGLLHAPYGVQHGKLHGGGIYVADNFNKALAYASGLNSRFVLVVSVTKGKVHKVWMGKNEDDEKPADIDTVWAAGRLHQDPAHDIILPSGDSLGMSGFKEVQRTDPPNKGGGFSSNNSTKRGLFSGSNVTKGGLFSNVLNNLAKESDEEEEEEEEEDDSVLEMEEYYWRYLPEYSEFIVKDPGAISLEYLVQIK